MIKRFLFLICFVSSLLSVTRFFSLFIDRYANISENTSQQQQQRQEQHERRKRIQKDSCVLP